MTLVVGRIGLCQKDFEGTDLLSARLLESHTTAAAPVVLEVAVIAQGHVANATIGGQILHFALALFDISHDSLSRHHLLFYL